MSVLEVLLGGPVDDVVPRQIGMDARFSWLRASTGEEALREMRAHHPALALVDAAISGMPGHEVCARARASEETRDIPIVLVIDAGSPYLDACMAAPCDAALERPLAVDRALPVLERILNTRQRRPIRMMVRVARSAQVGVVVFFGYTIDISDRGMLFEASDDLSLEEKVDLHFFLPACSEKIAVKGRVVRILDRSPGLPASAAEEAGYGIEFQDLSVKACERIRQYVERQGLSPT